MAEVKAIILNEPIINGDGTITISGSIEAEPGYIVLNDGRQNGTTTVDGKLYDLIEFPFEVNDPGGFTTPILYTYQKVPETVGVAVKSDGKQGGVNYPD